MVGIDFDVLILYSFLFEGDPDALNEGTEPASIKFQCMFCLMSLEVMMNALLH